MELLEQLETLRKSAVIPEINISDQSLDDADPLLLPKSSNIEAPNILTPHSLPQKKFTGWLA
jgi:hypothetical protein